MASISSGALQELRSGVQVFAVNLAATDATLEFAAAVTGQRVVVLGCWLGASGGAWTVGFLGDTTATTGNMALADAANLNFKLGDLFIPSASGEAGIINATRTGGDLDGFILYGYERV